MAVAAPARGAAPAAAPPPASPVKPSPARKRPLRPTRGRAATRTAAAAPARKPPARKAPARKPPARPSRPARTRAQRAVAGGQLIPLAVGRTAAVVSQLPDSGLVVRMTRGRAWIAVLGILLVGIVGLNVVTLSFAASSGKIDEQITTLEQENSILRGRDAQLSGIGAVSGAAAPLGLTMPKTGQLHLIEAGPHDVATAAARLAAAGSG
jgi:hypothetical protein